MESPERPPVSPLAKLRTISWAQVRAGQDWIRSRGLTPQQAFVLNHLAGNPGAIQRDIARETRTTPANVSGVLRGLEARNLVERRFEGGDERSKRVFATDAGIALITGHEEAMAAADESLLAPLTGAERTILGELLDKITADLPEAGNP
ncbi:MarR family winged helix-turn-helix transcriptional regulator [Umezawaea sp. Da 62-37]|uniref:MarR family winged helix-turn-helix transcriptional regulator n=1 Tax=Umezawaea sp. Da 62-37 TaxID=3075927 RepID=UPI0028F6F488|nr:MarR family winged helix-turn-helix transcriptional regulator [Umezawaea sp. Da 62-37]WNV85507.1 MarR family winged helix-turn-helix transcriptional regulator [Umezawaea sp. Da 62-37]